MCREWFAASEKTKTNEVQLPMPSTMAAPQTDPGWMLRGAIQQRSP